MEGSFPTERPAPSGRRRDGSRQAPPGHGRRLRPDPARRIAARFAILLATWSRSPVGAKIAIDRARPAARVELRRDRPVGAAGRAAARPPADSASRQAPEQRVDARPRGADPAAPVGGVVLDDSTGIRHRSDAASREPSSARLRRELPALPPPRTRTRAPGVSTSSSSSALEPRAVDRRHRLGVADSRAEQPRDEAHVADVVEHRLRRGPGRRPPPRSPPPRSIRRALGVARRPANLPPVVAQRCAPARARGTRSRPGAPAPPGPG